MWPLDTAASLFWRRCAAGGRDERDSPAAWSRTWLFRVTLDQAHSQRALAGGDDASDARWFPLDALPARLAFDHAKLLRLALS